MKNLTLKQFQTDLSAMSAAGTKFDAQSVDCGNIYFSMKGCSIEFYESEIAIFKPNASMEVNINFEMIDAVYKEENTYTLEFTNGMADLEISVAD